MNTATPKIWALQVDPKKWNGYLKKKLNFDYISAIHRNHLHKYNCLCSVFGEIRVQALQVQLQTVDFAETWFTRWMDFVVIQYSVSNSADLERVYLA
jgi:hypothetical protein